MENIKKIRDDMSENINKHEYCRRETLIKEGKGLRERKQGRKERKRRGHQRTQNNNEIQERREKE